MECFFQYFWVIIKKTTASTLFAGRFIYFKNHGFLFQFTTDLHGITLNYHDTEHSVIFTPWNSFLFHWGHDDSKNRLLSNSKWLKYVVEFPRCLINLSKNKPSSYIKRNLIIVSHFQWYSVSFRGELLRKNFIFFLTT